MRKLHIIGIGAGDPDHMTVQAIKALNEIDVFFIPDKGSEKEGLKRLRTEIIARFATEKRFRIVEMRVPRRAKTDDYAADVDAWHAEIAEDYRSAFDAHLAEGVCGGILVWGDPSLYDSTLRIMERVTTGGFALDYDVIPGVSSIQVLAARHRIALNRVGGTVAIMPARKLGSDLPDAIDDVVVVLDGDCSFRRCAENGMQIYWGANLGTANEILVSGRLADVMDEIEERRAVVKAENGWVMDTYLLRRGR